MQTKQKLRLTASTKTACIACKYEKLTNSRDLYKEHRIKIPFPEFVVLYNGEKEMVVFGELTVAKAAENLLEKGKH